VSIPQAVHFLGMPDCEGAFVPLDFQEPFEYAGVSIASLWGAIECLMRFAQITSFSLTEEFEKESHGDEWMPLSTMRNVARILYQFMSADKSKVVVFA
jgi:hypothetical protein